MKSTLKAHLISATITVVAAFLSFLAIQVSHVNPSSLDFAGILVLVRAALKLTVESLLTPKVDPLSV